MERATPRATPLQRYLRGDRAAPPEPRIRQHAHAGRAAVPGAVAHQRRLELPIALHHGSLDADAAAQGRGGDGGGHAEGGRRHLDARPRHRLGRRRSRDPRRRAQGRKPLHPAHRPRQSPARRALAGAPGAVEPLRGAGMPRRGRCGRGRRAGCGAVAVGRARCAGAARVRHGLRRRRSMPTGFMSRSFRPTPYAALTRANFDRVVDFVTNGGYALKSYDRYAKLKPADDGKLRLAHPRFIESYRLNAGTIVAAPLIKVRLLRRRGKRNRARRSSAVACWARSTNTSSSSCAPGDAFVLARRGRALRGPERDGSLRDPRRAPRIPIIPSYNSGKFPLSTHLAERVRALLADPAMPGSELPDRRRRVAGAAAGPVGHPGARRGADRDVPRRGKCHYLVAYPFEGRLAHQTLGMLLTRRLDRAGAQPSGLRRQRLRAWPLWGLGDVYRHDRDGRLDSRQLFAEDMLGDDLDAWLAESNLMKRTFRQVARDRRPRRAAPPRAR